MHSFTPHHSHTRSQDNNEEDPGGVGTSPDPREHKVGRDILVGSDGGCVFVG